MGGDGGGQDPIPLPPPTWYSSWMLIYNKFWASVRAQDYLTPERAQANIASAPSLIQPRPGAHAALIHSYTNKLSTQYVGTVRYVR